MPGSEEYDKWHDSLGVDVEADTPWHVMVKAYLSTIALSELRVLEIGCGRGGFACWLAGQNERPREIIAADFSPSAVEKGKKAAEERGLKGLTFEVGDIQAIGYPTASFDLVISCETIEHVPSPMKGISELARVLKPGGKLILTTPNYLNLMGLYRIYRRLIGRPFTEGGQPINHVVMVPRTLGWLHKAGLHLMKLQTNGHYLPFPGRVPVRFPSMDRAGWATNLFGLHSMFVAERPLDRKSA